MKNLVFSLFITCGFFMPLVTHTSTSEYQKALEILQLQALVQHGGGTIPLSALPPEIQKTIAVTLSEFFKPVFKLESFSEPDRYEQTRDLLRPYLAEYSSEFYDQQTHAVRYMTSVPLVSTSFGRVCLHHILQYPGLTLFSATQKERNLTRCLISLKKLAQQESLLLSLWKEEKSAERQAIARLYTPSQKINRSPYRQQIATLTTLARPGVLLACSTVGAMGAFYLGMYACNTPVMDSDLQWVSTLTAVGITPALMKEFENQEVFFKTIRYLHLKMNALATAIRAVDACTQLITEYPKLKQLPHAQLLTAHKRHASPALKKLFALLKTPTFKGKPSFFSHLGRVRAAYFLFHQAKSELVPLLTAVGEVDAYLAASAVFQQSS